MVLPWVLSPASPIPPHPLGLGTPRPHRWASRPTGGLTTCLGTRSPTVGPIPAPTDGSASRIAAICWAVMKNLGWTQQYAELTIFLFYFFFLPWEIVQRTKVFIFFFQIQCASMHAHLACIETAEENEFLRRLLKEIRGKLQLLKSEIICTVSIVYSTIIEFL